jgi:hypothetical protein
VSTFRNGQRVAYCPHPGVEPERGVITEAYATTSAHRVRYGDEVISKLTPHAYLVTDEGAEEIVMRAALAGLAAAKEVTALLNDLIGDGSYFRADRLRGAADAHRAHIARATLQLEESIRETMPLLTWVESGTAVHRD